MKMGSMKSISLVVFLLDDRLYGLHLNAVEKVLPAVDVTPLPEAPEAVLGLINLKGKIIPVFDVRKRFRLQEREICLEDHFIIARTSRRTVAIPVDSAKGVMEVPEQEIADAKGITPGLAHVEGVVKLKDGMLLIHDVERFLSLEEERALAEALRQQG
jgi:purine-binding chemotaxis protein CheW